MAHTRNLRGLCLLMVTAALLRLSPALAQEPLRSAKLVQLPITQVRIEDKFWAPRIEVNRSRTLETVHRKLLETGAIQNFAIAAGKEKGEFRGPFWSDSDVYKWLEGVSYSLAAHRDAGLEGQADEVISLIAAAQMPDGYLDTHFQLVDPRGRWTMLAFSHEMFCAGHLFEAAVAHYEASGKRTLLDVAIKNADHIDATFGPGKREGQPGHEEIELGLAKLYRATGERRYLQLAQFFLDQRGHSFFEREYARLDPAKTYPFLGRTITTRTLYDEFFRRDPGRFDTQYSQDHLPVRLQDKVVGHAVRAMYLYSGMADVASETADRPLSDALLRLYADLTTKRMYITGGIGPSARNEGFTTDYDLPNETAYQETCASIGVAMWSQRMLAFTGDARYADTMEMALYNGFPAGVSLGGDRFFYDNPLYSAGKVQRREWFSVPCCPTNVARILPSIGKFVYSRTEDSLWVNLFVQSRAVIPRNGGGGMTITQETGYPWSGSVKLRVSKPPQSEYALRIRVPGWAGGATFRLNGQSLAPAMANGYAVISRRWADGDTLALDVPMEVQRMEAHPGVLEDRGRVALRRGGIIYCLEQTDNAADIDRVILPATARLESRFDSAVLGGVSIITGQAMLKPTTEWTNQLYQPASSKLDGPIPIKAVPYCVWANRGAGKMAVWIQSGY